MAVIKWNPFEELDRFFEEDFVPLVPALKVSEGAVDIYEKDGKVYVEMPLAGYKPEEVNVEIEDNRLKISGKVERSDEEKKKNYYRKEIRRGSFERVVILPENADVDNAEAEFEDGLLRIVFPAKTEGRVKKSIKVKKK